MSGAALALPAGPGLAHDRHDDHDHGHGEHDHGHGGGRDRNASPAGRSHAGHAHGPGGHHGNANERRVFWAAAITGSFALVEVFGGIAAGSLALIADAGHMLTDAGGLLMAWIAFRIARRPADARRTFGFARMEVLVAFANGLFLLALAAFILIEAIRRLFEPVAVDWAPMLIVAVGGLLANIVAFVILHGADRNNLNIRGAVLHVLGDLLGSVGAIAAALVIMATDWTPADPILSVFVTLLIVVAAWRLVRDSAHILLEGAPETLDVAEIASDLPASVPGVASVHHVHAWSISQARPMVTLHACVDEAVAAPDAVLSIKRRLKERFAIDHATVEVERGECADAALGIPAGAARC